MNVGFDYDTGPALAGIDLHIAPGDSVVFIGPNGSGKSTLLKVISGLVVPHTGQYFFEGEEATAQRRRSQPWMKRLHQRVGFLFQNSDAQLFCPTVEDEVAFGPRQMTLDDAQVDQRVADCLNLLGIDHLRGRAPHHLSGGEKKKVALAAVLATNPQALLVDEPMNGLDPKSKRFLRGLLIGLGRAGKTLVGVTHDFAYVDGVFRTAVVLSEDHRILRVGPFSEVLEDEPFLVEHNIL